MNFTTTCKTISQRVWVNFALNKAQVLLLLTQEFRHQWFLQQVADNYWKFMPSEIKLLFMIKSINVRVDVSIFAIVQNCGLKIWKTTLREEKSARIKECGIKKCGIN